MWSRLLISHYQAPRDSTAASDVMQQELQRPVPGERERAATLRFPKAVILLAASTLVFSASGALAQVQEIVLPALSSGPRDTVPAPTPGIERPGSFPQATPSLTRQVCRRSIRSALVRTSGHFWILVFLRI